MSPYRLPPPILESQRIRLDPLVHEDSVLMFPLLGDPQVMAFWDISAVEDPALVDRLVDAQMSDMAAGKAYYWAIRDLSGQRFLGTCDLSDVDHWHKRAEIGFMLAPAAWGLGYGLEAMRSVIGFGASLGIRRLLARTHLGNRRSENLLAKLGFHQEGLLRGYVLRDGERRDCLLFGLLL